MTYPDYPNNRLIVNGVDLTTKFKMVLADGYTLEPPSPKTYTVDIPGGNGKLDLTESLLGDVAYDNRKQEFIFYAINTDDFESVKSSVSNFLHGKSYDYKLTMDPDYTYHGRFTVSSYEHSMYSNGRVGCIKVQIDADPFKYRDMQILHMPAIGGNIFLLPSGRKRVRPVFEVSGYTKVIFNGKQYDLHQGTWAINDILFTNGYNELYVNTYSIRILTWKDIKDNNVTWNQFKSNRLYEWYKSKGDGNLVVKHWDDIVQTGVDWVTFSSQTWGDQKFRPEVTDHIKDVYIKYEWGDL